MANSAYHIQANAKAKALGERFKNLLPTDANLDLGPTPKFENRYPEMISIEQNIEVSTGPNAIIDVQMDFRNCIQYICYHVTKMYSQFDARPQPFITPPSMTGYCLALIYLQGLLNDDDNVRMMESDYARDFNSSFNIKEIKAHLRKLYVPPFMIPLLNGLAVSIDERRPDIKYVYSLAAFDILYDYGRTPPISVFFTAHNILASQAANQPPLTINNLWFNTQIMSTPLNLYVANYLGLGLEHNFKNWFSQLCTSLFNPVTMRFNTIRPTFGTIPYVSQDFQGTSENVNPYIHLLGLDSRNSRASLKALRDISSSMHQLLNTSTFIGTIEYNDVGNQLTSHYYEKLVIPTFNQCTPTAAVTETDVTTVARNLKFLQLQESIPQNEIKFPDESQLKNTTLYLSTGIKYDPTKDPDTARLFNEETDVLNRVRHLSPFETKREELFFNIIHGKVIQIEELDSTCVPQPNPDSTARIENSYFLESAIPFTHIIPINCGEIQLFERAQNNVRWPTVRCCFYDRTKDTIPYYAPTTKVNKNTPFFKSFDKITNIPDTSRACNSLNYTIESEHATTEIPQELRKIYAWSCYRFINPQQNSSVHIRNRKFMLTNMRTLYGTNATLVETDHPANIIPQS